MENQLLSQHHINLKKDPEYKVGDTFFMLDKDAFKGRKQVYITGVKIKKTPHCRVKGFGFYPVYTISNLSHYAYSNEEIIKEDVSEEWIKSNLFENDEVIENVKAKIIKDEISELEKLIELKKQSLEKSKK